MQSGSAKADVGWKGGWLILGCNVEKVPSAINKPASKILSSGTT